MKINFNVNDIELTEEELNELCKNRKTETVELTNENVKEYIDKGWCLKDKLELIEKEDYEDIVRGLSITDADLLEMADDDAILHYAVSTFGSETIVDALEHCEGCDYILDRLDKRDIGDYYFENTDLREIVDNIYLVDTYQEVLSYFTDDDIIIYAKNHFMDEILNSYSVNELLEYVAERVKRGQYESC